LKGSFENLKGKAHRSRRKMKRKKEKKGKTTSTKPKICWLHALLKDKGVAERIQMPP